ncbi:hypothetical protein [Yoonia vestfoldensis]|uniref:hypothetical protein n=1 Tax=Yoonia vestfoldensis TaxID=245188 RepID=UPI00036D0232|nr:hypothetical protein [Yoonia vestfoldensis]
MNGFKPSDAQRQRIPDVLRARVAGRLPSPSVAERLELTLRLETPGFLFGHHPNEDPKRAKGDAHWRLGSILGVVRFWWRAAAWARALRACHGDRRAALSCVHAWQSVIWGSEGGQHGQGAAIWAVAHRPEMFLDKAWDARVTGQPGRIYMAGQGLNNHRPLSPRSALSVSATARAGWPWLGSSDTTTREKEHKGIAALADWKAWAPFAMTINDIGQPTAPPTIADALLLLHLFGGVGSRSRRGFGGLTVQGAYLGGSAADLFPSNAMEIEAAVMAILDAHNDIVDLPPYTALNARARVLFAKFNGKDTHIAHETLGFAMQRFRGWGLTPPDGGHPRIGPTVIDKEPERHSEVAISDHDTWYLPIANAARTLNERSTGRFQITFPTNPSASPLRAGFGLPMNSRSVKKKRADKLDQAERSLIHQKRRGKVLQTNEVLQTTLTINLPDVTKDGPKRRGSPFFLKVRATPDGSIGTWLFLPAVFLPEDMRTLTGAITYSLEIPGRNRNDTFRLGKFPATVSMPSPSDDAVEALADAFFADTLTHHRAGPVAKILSGAKAGTEETH